MSAEARLIAGGVAAAVATADGLTSLQRVMIEAVTESMTGFVVPLLALPPAGSGQVRATSLSGRTSSFGPTCSGSCCCAPWCSIRCRRKWLIGSTSIPRARRRRMTCCMSHVALPASSFGLALVDFQRSGYGDVGPEPQPESAHIAEPDRRVASSRAGRAARRTLGVAARSAARSARTRSSEVLRRPGLRVPGSTRGVAPPFTRGTIGSTCSPTTARPSNQQIEVFGFIARANDDPRAFSLLAQVISLFETGYTASGMGLFQYDRGHLSHQRRRAAPRRCSAPRCAVRGCKPEHRLPCSRLVRVRRGVH